MSDGSETIVWLVSIASTYETNRHLLEMPFRVCLSEGGALNLIESLQKAGRAAGQDEVKFVVKKVPVSP